MKLETLTGTVLRIPVIGPMIRHKIRLVAQAVRTSLMAGEKEYLVEKFDAQVIPSVRLMQYEARQIRRAVIDSIDDLENLRLRDVAANGLRALKAWKEQDVDFGADELLEEVNDPVLRNIFLLILADREFVLKLFEDLQAGISVSGVLHKVACRRYGSAASALTDNAGGRVVKDIVCQVGDALAAAGARL